MGGACPCIPGVQAKGRGGFGSRLRGRRDAHAPEPDDGKDRPGSQRAHGFVARDGVKPSRRPVLREYRAPQPPEAERRQPALDFVENGDGVTAASMRRVEEELPPVDVIVAELESQLTDVRVPLRTR